jgi:hypothetical protein
MNAGNGMYIDEINRRLIVRTYEKNDLPKVIDRCMALSLSHNLEKIWLWSFPEDTSVFLDYGFYLEGILETDTSNKPSASLAYYLRPYRNQTDHKTEED